MRLETKIRRKLNGLIYELTKSKYFDLIPLGDLREILLKAEIVLLQEDGTEWSGLLCGDAATTTFDLGDLKAKTEKDGLTVFEMIEDYCLALQWYRMPSGRYEIVAYVA